MLTLSAGREEAGEHMKGRGGRRGERKEVEDGCAKRQNHEDSCTEVKLLRACRRSEGKITLPSPPHIRHRCICISDVLINLENNGWNDQPVLSFF